METRFLEHLNRIGVNYVYKSYTSDEWRFNVLIYVSSIQYFDLWSSINEGSRYGESNSVEKSNHSILDHKCWLKTFKEDAKINSEYNI